MHSTIGTNAGIVWHFLKANGSSSVAKIAKGTTLKESDVHRAIGWLCREGKLKAVKEGNNSLIELTE